MMKMVKNSMSINSVLFNIPIPASISFMWNFGSLLGMCLMVQIFSGLFLSMHYNTSIDDAFNSVLSTCNDVNLGWLIRYIHANGASMFFMLVYCHIGRGLYFGSFNMTLTWFSGVIILLLLMGTSFLGYVLPWGQMSFWGATVITNLVSTIPYVGDQLVYWLWGGFSVSEPTLNRFFSIHFILPFVLMMVVLVHIFSLHKSGSSNPLGISPNCLKISFHPYFWNKDVLGFVVVLIIFTVTLIFLPDVFMDPDNFSVANPMSTPAHIQPEWYFLFAYAILRSIPTKLGGVVALVFSIVILFIIPFISSGKNKSLNFYHKMIVLMQVSNFLLLTWLGAMPVEFPFLMMSKIFSSMYFIFMILLAI
uniref:Cytochrome b n=1 Tax=Ibidoecus bisignatus TaxID=236520 RepID=G1EN78_9NEOP|nr:cytochrome b [Ibidoecus bisignatus]AEM23861.1 cytochrome b [Ibidoecus bisignatus]UTT72609.1 cytochrome b [Ibidoecus bisignatus]